MDCHSKHDGLKKEKLMVNHNNSNILIPASSLNYLSTNE